MSDKHPAKDNHMRPDRLSSTQKAMRIVLVGLSLFAAFFAAFAIGTVSDSSVFVFSSFAGVAAFGIVLSRFLVNFQSPPVTCLSCYARGWIEDLTPDSYACPVCMGDTFSYMRPRNTRSGHRIVQRDTEPISGKILVSRARGKFWD